MNFWQENLEAEQNLGRDLPHMPDIIHIIADLAEMEMFMSVFS